MPVRCPQADGKMALTIGFFGISSMDCQLAMRDVWIIGLPRYGQEGAPARGWPPKEAARWSERRMG